MNVYFHIISNKYDIYCIVFIQYCIIIICYKKSIDQNTAV